MRRLFEYPTSKVRIRNAFPTLATGNFVVTEFTFFFFSFFFCTCSMIILPVQQKTFSTFLRLVCATWGAIFIHLFRKNVFKKFFKLCKIVHFLKFKPLLFKLCLIVYSTKNKKILIFFKFDFLIQHNFLK